MKLVFSANQIKDCHGTPANHVFASFMIGGVRSAEQDYKKEADDMSNRMLAGGFDPVFTKAFIDWYKNSCAHLVQRLESGKKLFIDYPEFVPPAEGVTVAQPG